MSFMEASVGFLDLLSSQTQTACDSFELFLFVITVLSPSAPHFTLR